MCVVIVTFLKPRVQKFQVQMIDEGADDAGGVFDDIMTEMFK